MSQVTVDRVIAAYIATRDEIEKEKKAYEAKVADLKLLQAKREQWFAKFLDESGTTSVKKAGVGTCFFNYRTSATVADAVEFTEWVLDDWDERNHFLERRVSKTAVDKLVEDGAALPSGVNYTRTRVVQVNRG